MYDVLLLGYVGFPGTRTVSTPQWRMSLQEATVGLTKHRMAAEFAREGKHSDAETMANEALKHVEKRLVSMSLEFVSG